MTQHKYTSFDVVKNMILGRNGNQALFLDLDGSLVDIAARPGEVVIPDGLDSLINCLYHKLGGAIAIITGRDLDFIDTKVCPHFRLPVSTEHGAFIRTESGGEVTQLVPDIDPDIDRRLGNHTLPKYAWIEKKATSRVIHFRQSPDTREVLDLARGIANTVATDYNSRRPADQHVHVTEGDRVFEIGPKLHDKGTVVRMFMDHPAFQNRRPIFIGDTQADMPGMDEVRRHSGLAIGVTEKTATFADVTVESPTVIRSILSAVLSEMVRRNPIPQGPK